MCLVTLSFYLIAVVPEPAEPPAFDDFAAMGVDPPSVGGGDSGVDLAAMDFQPTPPGEFFFELRKCIATYHHFLLIYIGQYNSHYMPILVIQLYKEYSVPLVNGNGVNSNHSAASSKGPSPVPAVPRIEAENIRRWREQQKILLEKKGKLCLHF